MSVWVAFPTVNPERAAQAAVNWSCKGYRVAILTNTPDWPEIPQVSLHLKVKDYPGYFVSCNVLCKALALLDQDLVAVCCAADDMHPDPDLTAEALGEQYLDHFRSGYGVMQPVGDDLLGTDAICGSPWFGRAWIERAYFGRGPFCGLYKHFFGDEELRHYAKFHGALWDRPDVTQRHDHWTRGVPKTPYQCTNSDDYWRGDQITFEHRRNTYQWFKK